MISWNKKFRIFCIKGGVPLFHPVICSKKIFFGNLTEYKNALNWGEANFISKNAPVGEHVVGRHIPSENEVGFPSKSSNFSSDQIDEICVVPCILLFQGLRFKSLIRADYIDSQQNGQPPITFVRQVS